MFRHGWRFWFAYGLLLNIAPMRAPSSRAQHGLAVVDHALIES
jgi:hypothetical protein